MAWFDADTVPEDDRPSEYTPIPEGEYKVIIARVEDKNTQKGGKMLAIGYQVIEGAHKDRWIWDNINYVCSNATAQLIGEQTLKKICNEIGKPTLQSPEDLKDIPFTIKVKVKRNEYKGELENVFSWVKETKGKVKASTGSYSEAPKPRPIEEPIPEDDIPF